jgi:hypothetical protein
VPHVIGLFRSSYELEKTVTHLLSHQFEGTQLTVVPMHMTDAAPRPRGIRRWLMSGGVFGDTLDRSDGTSVLDGIIAGATIGGLAGIIAGAAVLPGPVALGTAGILGGGLIGYLLDILIPENKREEYSKAMAKSSTLLQVDCRTPEEAKTAMLILRENQPHEVGHVPAKRGSTKFLTPTGKSEANQSPPHDTKTD